MSIVILHVCVHKPHLQVMAVLWSEVVQGHIGVELEDIFW